MTNTKPKIAITGRIPSAAVDALRAIGDVWTWDVDDVAPTNVVHEAIAGANAVVTLLTTRVDTDFLAAAGPTLRVVANVAVGYNNIDVAACTSANVRATNTPGVLTDATADIAMALVLMSTRRLGEGERVVRSGEPWQWGMFHLLGTGLRGKRLGIIGMGDIGAALARRARAFGMTIAYTNRNAAHATVVAELDAHRCTIDELLATSDVVSVNCPYSSETHHLIGATQLAAMQSHAFLVNTARGPIVDEAALAAALHTGTIAGAGLDVYEHEPVVHPDLLTCENAVLIPHLGSATVETRTAMAMLAAQNVIAVLNGAAPPTPIN
jgi:glyoxylate reductase